MSAGNGAAPVEVDFSDFIPLDSMEHEVLKPDGTKTGWIITLCDASHPKAQAYDTEMTRRRLRKEAQREVQLASGRRPQLEEKSVDEARLENVRWLISRIEGWRPAIRLPVISQEPIAFSEEAATRVLMHPKMSFVVSQLLDILISEKSFMKRSAMESGHTPSDNLPSQYETKAE